MSSPRDDLRSTEESIRRDAEQVKVLEDRKAALDPTDPRLGQLVEQIERLARVVQGKTAAGRELSEELESARQASGRWSSRRDRRR